MSFFTFFFVNDGIQYVTNIEQGEPNNKLLKKV